MKRLDHADLVREAVELGGRHDHGVDGLLAHRVDLAREDADLEGDGASGRGVVAREHVDLDAGAVALAHGPLGLGARRVVQADEAEQGHALLELGAVVVAVRGRRAGERLGGEGEDAKALLGERLDVGEDLLLRLVVDWLGAVGRLDRLAHLDEALDGALHEDELLPASRASWRRSASGRTGLERGGEREDALVALADVESAHALDVAVEGRLVHEVCARVRARVS